MMALYLILVGCFLALASVTIFMFISDVLLSRKGAREAQRVRLILKPKSNVIHLDDFRKP